MAKNVAASAKNVINVTKTIAERQQMRSVSTFYSGMFSYSDYSLPESVIFKDNLKDDSEFNHNLISSMGTSDFICSAINVNNQLYKNGDLVIVGIEDCDNMHVGLIKTILVKNDKVYFVIQRYAVIRNQLQYFESKKPTDNIHQFLESSKILDHKPLIMRGTAEKFIFTLHHYVSYDYQ